jgi:hypothetical protein
MLDRPEMRSDARPTGQPCVTRHWPAQLGSHEQVCDMGVRGHVELAIQIGFLALDRWHDSWPILPP